MAPVTTEENVQLKIVELLESGVKGGEFQIRFGPYSFDWRRDVWTVIKDGIIITKQQSLSEAMTLLLNAEVKPQEES